MATITTRAGKGTPLTNTEVDDNFTNLNTDKAELSGATFTGNVGIGTSPTYKADINVNSTSANDTQVALRIKSTTTANMTNGFGVNQLFSIEDSSGANFNIAQLRVVRDGADDSGAFLFAPYSTGTATERMRITSSGNVGIGATNPYVKTEIAAGDLAIGSGEGASVLGLEIKGVTLQAIPSAQVRGYIATGDSTIGVAGDLLIAPRTDVIASIRFITGTSPAERMRINASGNVGIGTTSPSEALHIANGGLLIDSNIPDAPVSGTSGFIVDYYDKQTRFWSRGDATTAGGYQFKILENDGGSQADAMVIDSSGNVGIGTSSPASEVDISKASGGDSALSLTSTGVQRHQIIQKGTGDGSLVFYNQTANAERMRIDSSGHLLVGTTEVDVGYTDSGAGFSAHPDGYVQAARSSSSALSVLYLNKLDNDGSILEFSKDGEAVGSIGSASSGYSLYIQAGDAGLKFEPLADDIKPCTTDGANRDGAIDLGDSAARFKDLYLSGTGYVGSLLVGTTADVTSTNAGVQLRADNTMRIAKADGAAQSLYRLNSDGNIINFYKVGTSVGSIGTVSGDIRIGGSDDNHAGIRFAASTKSVIPVKNTDGDLSDNTTDLGASNSRFKDLYLSGSTFSTSDRNKKQDIRDLTDAEARVATVAKGSLKAFRYIDSVEAEGDEANIHFGIIAQDLKAAFEAEGLNANDYQVFKTSTYTDDDGVEQTTYSVCYVNLLAFIIAAI